MKRDMIVPGSDNKKSLIVEMAARYGMEPKIFQETIKQTVMPGNATNEQMAAFLLVANEYRLNPIIKEIHAFPGRGGGVTPVVGIDGWINLAQRRDEFDGMDFEYHHNERGDLESVTCVIWRKDRSRPVKITEFMAECRRTTDPWKSHPRRLLRHKATIQAIRYAFGFSGIHDEDEAAEIAASPSVVSSTQVESASAKLMDSARAFQQKSVGDAPHTEIADAEIADAEIADAEIADAEIADADQSVEAWPQEIDGQFIDARGVPWIGHVHSGNKTCTNAGVWRRRIGVSEEVMRDAEKAIMEPRTQPEAQPEARKGKTIAEQFRDAAIAAVNNRDWDSVRLIEQDALKKLTEQEAAHLHNIIVDLKNDARGSE